MEQVNIDPDRLRFLRESTGADSNAQVIADAVTFYEGVINSSIQNELVCSVRRSPEGRLSLKQLDLALGRPLSYAREHPHHKTIAQDYVDVCFEEYVRRTRNVQPKPDDGPGR